MPNITLAAPPARARATSRGQRTPPSAHTCLPSRVASVAHSTTAENWGRPTPVIILVVHIAPGPTPTLTTSAPASISCRVPSAVTTFPATSGRSAATDRTDSMAWSIRVWWPWAVSMTSTSAPIPMTALALVSGSPLTPTATPIISRPSASRAGRYVVDRRVPLRVTTPSNRAVAVDDGRHRAAGRGELLERLAGLGAVGNRDQLAAHHGVELGEAVEPGRVVFGEHADRPVVVVDDHHRTMGALVHQPEGVADGVVGRQRDRRLVDLVAALHVLDDGADDVERNVLRQDHDPAAAGDGLGHPLSGDGGHVRHDDRDRRADAVRRGEVDVEARWHGREAGDHEHVVVGEVVTGFGVEQAHRRSPRVRSRPVKVMSTGAHLRCVRVRCSTPRRSSSSTDGAVRSRRRGGAAGSPNCWPTPDAP